MSVIDVTELTYRYPDGTEAVTSVDLEITEGEFTAFIGQNGSGKTTCAKCLSGLFEPTEGTVKVNGRSTTDYDRADLARRVGYVFQNPDHQLFTRSVRAEIETGPTNLGMSGDELESRVRTAAETAGVDTEYFDQHPFFLTKGLRQRVAIASILAMQPRTIIVDEPTTGQDHPQSLSVMDFLTKLNQERGHTVIIITHDIHIVARYAERVILFGDGTKLADGPTRDVFADRDTLKKASVKPPQITQFSQIVRNETALTVSELLEARSEGHQERTEG